MVLKRVYTDTKQHMYVYQSQEESGGWGEGELKFKEETH